MSLIPNEVLALVDADDWCDLPHEVRADVLADLIAAETSMSLAELRAWHDLG